MTINPQILSLIQFCKTSKNPNELIYNMIDQRMGGNPIFANLLSLAKEGRGTEIEVIARNMFKEKGLDFDKEFENFK